MSSVQEFLSTNQRTILYVVIAAIVAYMVWGWYQGYQLTLNYNTNGRRQQQAEQGFPANMQ